MPVSLTVSIMLTRSLVRMPLAAVDEKISLGCPTFPVCLLVTVLSKSFWPRVLRNCFSSSLMMSVTESGSLVTSGNVPPSNSIMVLTREAKKPGVSPSFSQAYLTALRRILRRT